MDISIIIVNYNSQAKTLNCLKSISDSELRNISYEIIVVDNDSIEKIENVLHEKFPAIKYIQSKKNLGMGGGNNLGIKQSTGDFVLVLNPDTTVSQDSINILFHYIKSHPLTGIVGPKLLNPDNSLQYSCFREYHLFIPILRRTFLGKIFARALDDFLMKDFDHEEIKEVDWLLGSCLLIRKELLDKIGLFDKRFFMYFEDTDLCRRVWQVGFKVIYNPMAVVIHDHVRASAEKPWIIAPFIDKLAQEHIKSWLKYFWKWRIDV